MLKFLSSLVISASLVLAPIGVVAQTVQGGEWEEGAQIQWVCTPKAKGSIPFAIKLSSGQIYKGVISCGNSV